MTLSHSMHFSFVDVCCFCFFNLIGFSIWDESTYNWVGVFSLNKIQSENWLQSSNLIRKFGFQKEIWKECFNGLKFSIFKEILFVLLSLGEGNIVRFCQRQKCVSQLNETIFVQFVSQDQNRTELFGIGFQLVCNVIC